ncbi:MAG: PD-(D/E)XK nuclease family protein, partial [Candidatus Obscuribacterales bacterium]|nr:PD-(D/E)XK nuclease family protein [Steroidobacteraceae bacterium]
APRLLAAIEGGDTIVTPNQRSAHWLKLLYANHALSQERSAWPTPAIHSFNSFVWQLWNTQGAGDERVLNAEQSRLVWEQVVSASPWTNALLNPEAAASSSFRAWERLQAWRIDRDALADQTALANSDEAGALLEWSDRFSQLCAQRSWLPIALLPHRLLGASFINGTAPRRIVITATHELLPSHRALLAHLANAGIQCDQHVHSTIDGDCRAIECISAEHELRAAALWAREQLSAGRKSVGVVVSDLETHAAPVRRVFAEVFAQAMRTVVPPCDGERAQTAASFSIASYHRLTDFPLARAALDTLQLAVGRASSTLAGALLRSSFLSAAMREAPHRALADARLRSHGREHYDLTTLEQTIALTNTDVFAQCLRDARAIRHAAPPRGLPSVMAEQFIALWRAFGWPGEQVLDSREQQIAARMQQCLAEFGALDELLGPLTFAAAVREFEQLTRNTSFEPRSLPAPITIVDALAVDGLQFEALWVTGITESQWPPPASPDPFIPIDLQIQAGMPHATAQLARELSRQRFAGLQRMAERVVFSYASKDGDVEILPSAWLQALPKEKVCEDTSNDYATRIYAARPALEVLMENHAPPLTANFARGGTRIFELQSHCPFRAFAELRLGAKPLDQVAPSVDASERGQLIHAALAEIWETLQTSAGLQARDEKQLQVLVHTALAKHASKLLAGASPHRIRIVQIEQDLAAERIHALLELDRQRMPFRVVGRPETAEFASIGNLKFELRLDRIDELRDAAHHGERIIIDYKTGNNVSTQSWTHERPEQPQLPLYAVTHPHELAAVVFATVGAKGVAYQGVARSAGLLPDVKAFNGKSLPPQYVGWEGLLAYWRVVIARLADQFVAGEAQVDPLPTACRYCHLSTLCRIREKQHDGLTLLNDGEDLT